MSDTTLAIPFSLSSQDEYEYLLIEQEPWAKDVGKTTALQALAGISAAVYGSMWPAANCGGDATGFDMDIHVYPSTLSMVYQFHITHATRVSVKAGTFIRDEMVQCGLSDSAELDYPCQLHPVMQWIGKLYDATGAVVYTRPTVTRTGRKLHFSQKVYGSLRVRYYVYRKTYAVRVEERDDSIENNFDSVVYCNWDGGVRWLECKPPSGYDYTAGECGNGADYGDGGGGGSVIVNPDDDGYTPPVAPERDRDIVIDYCSQELKSDSLS